MTAVASPVRPESRVMTVDEVHDLAGWRALESQWNTLVDQCAAPNTFLTWEWMQAWWSAYAAEGTLRVFVVRDPDRVIQGIAPMRHERIRRYGRAYESLAFIGDGTSDSDYLDVIASTGHEGAIVEALLSHWRARLADGWLLRLNDIAEGSPVLAELRRQIGSAVLWAEETIPCGTLALPEDWNAYLNTLRPRFRTKVRSVLRNIESRDDVRFGWCETREQIEPLLTALFDLHTRRWQADGRTGVFGWDRKRTFYRDLTERLLARGTLRFSWLAWRDQLLACQYGFVHGSTYFHLQEGYEPASEHWNVGIALRAWTIRHFIGAGIREYDSLAGIGRHKTDWGATVKESRRVTIGSTTRSNALFFSGPRWEERAKATVRRVVPARLLPERATEAAAPAASNGQGEYVRRAAAKAYFHLGLSAATRRIHHRYQVTSSPSGGLSGLSVSRRREPAGRILYYHRVNDDRDPFFGATPVSVFEQQMRYIARHYTVVSLTDLVDHLDSGNPETRLAVTFDDGYRDNYQNAFPILQRYGLPATIFLATGPIDSGEPLWFERLTAAMRRTSREYLDLELDVPRRFWLRTESERIRSNTDLFARLRRMPDDQRHDRLREIFTLLDVHEQARPEAMLTWDQVRAMSRHRIDFGGHTVTHPYLSRLPLERANWELTECKRRVETELQRAVAHFAYPNGREEDFAPWSKDAVRAAGYKAAVTTMWGLNYNATDRMELRRGQPWEDDEALFAYKMDWYQLVNG